jgi:hypothetical protein
MAGPGVEDVPGAALQGQPRLSLLASAGGERVGLEDLPPGGTGVYTVHENSFLALPGHFGAKKGLLSRFRQVVAPLRRVVQPLRRVVQPLRRALAALRRVVRALRRALAALRRVVRALRCALAALRRVVQPLRRALAELRRVVAALRPALFYEFDAFPCLHDHVLLFTKPGDTESDPKSGVSRAGHLFQCVSAWNRMLIPSGSIHRSGFGFMLAA